MNFSLRFSATFRKLIQKLSMILVKLFLLNTLAILCFGDVWDTDEIDTYVEAVRKCWHRPAVTIGIVELDENDKVKQSYANAYGRLDPSCHSNCDKVSQANNIVGVYHSDTVNTWHNIIFCVKIFHFTSYFQIQRLLNEDF